MSNPKFRFILILLSLAFIVINPLMISCSSQASTPTNTSTPYPAQITGNVIVPKFLRTASITDESDPAKTGWTYWIVNVTFTNKGYNDPEIKSYYLWTLVAGDKTYAVSDAVKSEKLTLSTVAVGQTGETTLCFQVPYNLNVSDTWLKYDNKKTVSFGKLTGGESVPGYDWTTKSVVNPR